MSAVGSETPMIADADGEIVTVEVEGVTFTASRRALRRLFERALRELDQS